MSTSGGPRRTRAQAHQNTFAFRHNPKSKKTAIILSLPNEGLCQRCHDKIEWRKKYRKYKPLKAPAFCNYCKQKTVRAAYHVCCQPCAKERKICAFCCESRSLVVSSASKSLSLEEQRLKLEQSVAHLPLRKRKTILREFDQNEGASDVEALMARAAAMTVDEDDDDFDFDDDDFDYEEEEEEEEEGGGGVRRGDFKGMSDTLSQAKGCGSGEADDAAFKKRGEEEEEETGSEGEEEEEGDEEDGDEDDDANDDDN